MPWGKIDDAFDEDQRVINLLMKEGEPGVTAFGLWGLCFIWANRNTRRRGKQPGLLPHLLPMQKMGPYGMALAELLVKHELWAHAGAEGDGWLIVDFADTLPTKDLSSKRAEAGRRGAQKRWAAKRAAEAAAAGMANGALDDSKLLQPEGTVLQPDGTDLGSEGNDAGPVHSNRVLPDGNTALPSVCHVTSSEFGSNEPPNDGTLLSNVHPDGREDNSTEGTLLSIDGSLPLGIGSIPHASSKTAPQSLSRSQPPTEKEPSPAGAGDVLSLAGSSTPNGKNRTARGERGHDYASPGFARFWETYGGKGKPRAAATAYRRALTRADETVILAAATAYVASTPDPTYRLNAENWLNDDGWLATPTPAAPRRAAGGSYAPGPYQEPPESVYRHNRI